MPEIEAVEDAYQYLAPVSLSRLLCFTKMLISVLVLVRASLAVVLTSSDFSVNIKMSLPLAGLLRYLLSFDVICLTVYVDSVLR